VRITPLDIRNHGFQRRIRGYDAEEVDAFMRMVSEDYESLLRESQTLREKLAKAAVRIEDLASTEGVLKETLTTAQKLGADLQRTAMKEAEVLISEAEIKGEKILDAAHRRAAKLAEDIREMKNLRARVSNAVRATLETHLSVLESLQAEASDDPILDGKVAYLTGGERKGRSDAQGNRS
jgi:cell division initiation protein